jgi:hypothetical protein
MIALLPLVFRPIRPSGFVVRRFGRIPVNDALIMSGQLP